MSDTTVWTVDPAIYAYAKQNAKARAKKHWTEKQWNLWKTYRTTTNPNWFDPWFESEMVGNFNGPATETSPEAYERTQNMYMMYCWLSFKGYSLQSMTAMLSSTWQESTVAGGMWEHRYKPYAGNNISGSTVPITGDPDYLKAFDPTSLNGMGTRTWYGGMHASGGTTTIYTPTEKTPGNTLRQFDYIATMQSGEPTYAKNTIPAGSWAAVQHYTRIQTQEVVYQGVTYTQPVYQADGQGKIDLNSATDHAGGYGLVQWTMFPVLIQRAGMATSPEYLADPTTPMDEMSVGDGAKHWQLNLTLQLMVWEFERQQAMLGRTLQWQTTAQGGTVYTPMIHSSVVGNKYWNSGMGITLTWDQWASDAWVAPFRQQMEDWGVTDNVEWHVREMGLELWRCHYIISPRFEQVEDWPGKTNFVQEAIKWWNNNGGWDVLDIPRPRDIAYSELDQYHTEHDVSIILLAKRRKNRNVRTVFL